MTGLAKTFLYLIYAMIVAGMVTAITLSLRSDNTPKPVAHKPATSQNQPVTQPNSSASEPQPTGASQTSGAPATQLSNSGPGDVVGLFLAASLAGGVAYRWRLVRRLN